MKEPLAYRMRPEKIEEVVGQEDVIGEQTALYKMIKNGYVPSMLLYGPPGTGKTSLAYAIAGSSNMEFFAINATSASKKDVEHIIQEGRLTRNVLLFIDEIHRFHKGQQDTLLNAMEEGVITFIGATTENPYHSVNNAIRSRCGQIKQLQLLGKEDIVALLNRALQEQRGLADLKINMAPEAIELIAETTGDGRTALTILEEVVFASNVSEDETYEVELDLVKSSIQNKGFVHDNKGDIYYDLLSGFQKSIRGSDADAAMYYLARLLEGGDLESIMRRLLVIAYEDIGLASPDVAARVVPAIQAVERLGLPEARIPLSVITLELCLSPKSNTAYKALDKAIKHVKKGITADIPEHLKDSHYAGAAQLGHGVEYKYPHQSSTGWVYQEYLPESLQGMTYYNPKKLGDENKYAQTYEKLQRLKNEARKNQQNQ